MCTRDTKARRDVSLGQGTLYFGHDDLQHPATHREVYHMPGTWKVTTNHRHDSGIASFPVAHIGNRYVVLEKNGLSNSSRCLLKIYHSEEITKFHLCSHLHRTIYDCNRIRPTPHITSDNGPCYNSKEFRQFLQHYNITHQTSSPNHPRSYGFVERMVRVAKKLMDKAGKEGKPWISGLFDYRVTPPNQKRVTLNSPQVHQFGFSTGRMLHGNQQQ